MAKKGPGTSESGESRVAAEDIVVERFAGTNLPLQVLVLSAQPLLPLTVEVWDTGKECWIGLEKSGYSVATVNVTLVDPVALPASANPEDRNIRVTYLQEPLTKHDLLPHQLESDGVIDLAGADPDESIIVSFSPDTGKGDITRIVVTRESAAGTAYDVNSRSVWMYDLHALPTVNNILANFSNLEPSAVADILGQLINETEGGFNGPIEFRNVTTSHIGEILVRITATGGAVDSRESYSIKIQGDEKQ